MRIAAMVAGIGLVVACTPAAPPAAAGPLAADWFAAPLTFETTSWGKPTQHFTVAADGTAELWRIAPTPGGGFYDYTVEKYRGTVAPAALARFRTGFAPYATGKLRAPGKCELSYTDAPSSWIGRDKASALIAIYHGCGDKAFIAYANPLADLVVGLRDAIVVEAAPFATETFPPKPDAASAQE